MYAKEIAKGVAWLDEQHGGRSWVGNVKASQLNISKTKTCMLGQLYGDFARVVDTGSISRVMHEAVRQTLHKKSMLWAMRHGFAVSGKDGVVLDVKYAILTLEWMLAVKRMQRAYKAEEETPAPEQPAEEVTTPEEIVESPFGTPSPLQMEDLSEVSRIKK